MTQPLQMPMPAGVVLSQTQAQAAQSTCVGANPQATSS